MPERRRVWTCTHCGVLNADPRDACKCCERVRELGAPLEAWPRVAEVWASLRGQLELFTDDCKGELPDHRGVVLVDAIACMDRDIEQLAVTQEFVLAAEELCRVNQDQARELEALRQRYAALLAERDQLRTEPLYEALERLVGDIELQVASLTSPLAFKTPPMTCPAGGPVERLRWWAMALCDARSLWMGRAKGLTLALEAQAKQRPETS